MFNKSGFTTTTGAAPTQILADVEHQVSVGCIVSSAVQATANDGSRKIAKAGTPLVIDLSNLQTPATTGTIASSGGTANAVLLHDVDVTAGNANGTALIFGFVNVNRMDETTAALYTVFGPNVAGGVTALKA